MKKLFFKLKYWWYPIILFIILIILTTSKLHGLSAAFVNPDNQNLETYTVNYDYRDPNLLFGNLWQIRFDEWNVNTPFILGQITNNFQPINNNFFPNFKTNFFILTPTYNWKVLFSPTMIGFLFLPAENAVSLFWWSAHFLLLVSSYFFFLIISKGKLWPSIFFSLFLFLSPFIHWWSMLNTNVLSFMLLSATLIIIALKLISKKKKIKIFILNVLAIYFATAAIFSLYPPFLIAIAIVLISIFLGWLIDYISQMSLSKIHHFLKVTALVLTSFVITIGLFLLLFFVSFKDEISLMANASYPGKRDVVIGGGLNFFEIFSGPYNFNSQNPQSATHSILNQSENSNFILFFPLIFMYLLFTHSSLFFNVRQTVYKIFNLNYSYEKSKKNSSVIFLFSFISGLFLLNWIAGFDLPRLLSKITLLNIVPVRRGIIGLGVVNAFVVFYYLYIYNNTVLHKLTPINNNINKCTKLFLEIYNSDFFYPLVFALINSAVTFEIGLRYLKMMPGYLDGWNTVIIVTTIMFVASLALLKKWKKFFLLIILPFLFFSVYKINPIYYGLENVLNNVAFEQLYKTINDANISGKRVAMFSESVLAANSMAAKGVPVLNPTFIYPHFDFYKQLDPNKTHYEIYNRYHHLTILDADINLDEYTLGNPSQDRVSLTINPCNPTMKNNLIYAIFINPVQYPCLKFKNVIHNGLGKEIYWVYNYSSFDE